MELNTLDHARPGSPQAAWVSTALWIVKDFCAPGWQPVVTQRGKELVTTDERDQLMVDIAKDEGLTIVSRDRRARRRARDAGVVPFKPEVYAATVLTFDVARDRFMSRLDTGAAAYRAKYKHVRAATAGTEALKTVYTAIWEGPGYIAAVQRARSPTSPVASE